MRRSASLVRVTLAGAELEGLDPDLPAASVRLLLPPAGATGRASPRGTATSSSTTTANGRPSARSRRCGSMPTRASSTSRSCSTARRRCRAGRVGRAGHARRGVGHRAAATPSIPHATSFLLAGDESAVPAIATLLPHLPAEASVRVLVERRADADAVELPDHPGAERDVVRARRRPAAGRRPRGRGGGRGARSRRAGVGGRGGRGRAAAPHAPVRGRRPAPLARPSSVATGSTAGREPAMPDQPSNEQPSHPR